MEAQECETKTWKNEALCKMFLGTYNINLDLVLFVCLFVFSPCRPDGIGTITVDEKAWFEEIKIRLWNLLAYQITRYR